jgi:pyruvate ferredoxin oxidoreductase gamma subunit
MSKMIEIRWHGRGGQGAVTAAKILAEAALGEGRHIQAFPEYGAERRGAPVRSFTRISDTPIVIHSPIESPQAVAVLDSTLLDAVDVTEGLPQDGVLVVNTQDSPADVRKKLNLKGRKVFTVDATQISIDCLGKPIPNAPMIGAIMKATDILPIEGVIRGFKHKFSEKLRPEMIEGNVKAIQQAYEEVKTE